MGVCSQTEHEPMTVCEARGQGGQEEDGRIDVIPEWSQENEKLGLVDGEY